MEVKIKRLSQDAVIPQYAKNGDAGMDLVATSVEFDQEYGCIRYGTDLAIEIPNGYVGLIYPRSSIYKYPLNITNCVPVIDSGYRGEIKLNFNFEHEYWYGAINKDYFQEELNNGKFYFYQTTETEYRGQDLYAEVYKIGDRIAQLMIVPYPKIEFIEVEELSKTDRGTGGFGSTNK